MSAASEKSARPVARVFRGLAAFALGVIASCVLLEGVLRFLPVSKGAHGAEPDPSWPAHHLIPNAEYTFSTGWDLEDVRHGRVNNMGYTSPFDYVPGTSGVFVVGDSFIDNQMNDYAESIQGRLPSLLGVRMPVLAFGISGATLPHDLGVASLIASRFKPIWAVVLITRGNFLSGFGAKPGYFRWSSGDAPGIALVPERSHGRLGELIRDLSLVNYARSNLRADFSTLFADKSRPGNGPCTPATLSDADRRLLRYAAQELPPRFRLPPSHVILVFDADRAAIYSGDPDAARCPPRDQLADRYLASQAAAEGIEVIDLEPEFRAEFAQHGTRFDYLPVDGHWNAQGHAVAAREIARYINASAAR
jgi:hypothetical protein